MNRSTPAYNFDFLPSRYESGAGAWALLVLLYFARRLRGRLGASFAEAEAQLLEQLRGTRTVAVEEGLCKPDSV